MKIIVGLSVVSAFLTVCLLFAVAQRQGTTPATRERRASSAGNVTVKRGGNLQAAINEARYGDVIVLEAGATYLGPITLPAKESQPGNASFITITTSNPQGIPAENERVIPEVHASAMPKILSPTSSAAIGTAAGAHHYKFVGIEFAPVQDAGYIYNLVNLGEDKYTTAAQFPHDLIFDRCYVRSPGLNKVRRGFALNSGATTIMNSHISGFAGAGDETQGICGWNGPGPFSIVNNYIEGGAQNIMFGGSDPAMPNLVPANIEIRRNFLYKPAEWYGKATIKAVIELKNSRNVSIDGNVLESPGLIGAFVITVRNQNGGAPWSTLEDINITNNVVRHSSTGFSILGRDNERPSQQAKRIRIANNLLVDVGPDSSAVFLVGCCADSVTIENNTVQQTGNIMTCYDAPMSNFVFRNNIVQYNLYGLYCPVDMLKQGSKGNIIVDNQGAIASNGQRLNMPLGNFVAGSLKQVGFVDVARGDWSLADTSKIKGRGTNGKDPGVDFVALREALAPTDVEIPYFGKRKK